MFRANIDSPDLANSGLILETAQHSACSTTEIKDSIRFSQFQAGRRKNRHHGLVVITPAGQVDYRRVAVADEQRTGRNWQAVVRTSFQALPPVSDKPGWCRLEVR
jgi:hypothetical protein